MNEFLPIQLCDLQNNTFTSSAKMMWVNYLQLCLVLATIGSSFFISKKLNQINPSFLQRNIGHKYPLQGINLVDDVDINTLEETKEYMRTVYNQESKVREHLGSISNDDIEVEYLSEGFTNYCFRCYSTSDPSKNVFIKHAKENTKQLSNFKLSSNRLTTEYIASRTFSKYTPSVLPKVLHYNDTSKYLITEFLTDFRTLKEYMIEGVIDVDCCRFMGTVMGRSHARTHEAILNISSITRFRQEFGNLDHFQVWKTNMFDPTMTTLAESEHRVPIKPTSTSRSVEGPQVVEVQEQIVVVESEAEYIEQMLANFKISVETFEEGKLTPLDKQIEESTQSLLDGLNKDGDVTRAVTELQAIYLDKKQCLIHGDLHSGNVMMADPGKLDYESMNIDHQSPFRVVDFEKACFGPAGLDLGMFLANYLWYYIASPNPSARRSIISAVLTVLEAYKSAFRVQISNALAHTQTSGTSSSGDSSSSGNVLSTRTVDDLLDEIIVDALGFLGLYPLFLCVALPHIPMLPLEGVYGLNWGDCTGKLLSIRRRHLLSSVDALNQFHHLHTDRKKHSQTRSSSGSSVSDADRLALSSKAILRVFNADEERFLVDHPTEFWF